LGASLGPKYAWTEKEFGDCKKAISESTSIKEALKKHQVKYPHRTLSTIRHKFAAIGESYGDLLKKQDASTGPTTRDREAKIRGLEKQLDEMRANQKDDNKILEIIHGSANKNFNKIPKWLAPARQRNLTGMPCLDLSDIHHGEIVNAAEIGYVNSFNRAISCKRLEFTFKMAVELPLGYFHKPKYDGFVLSLNGDLISGNIHEELEATNDGPVLESVWEITWILAAGISLLADKYGRVFVTCIAGNHGRIRQKKYFKQRARDSYEWLVYQFLFKHFEKDDRVTINIPDSPDIIYSIYGISFLQTHGDQFSGGGGISGIYTPLNLGMLRKKMKQQAINKPFHIMKCGHFHQYIHSGGLIVNGSVKGYDEYANSYNFQFEPPTQALYTIHPEHGVTYRMPILCDRYEKKNQSLSQEIFKAS
jgi:hypothetical protein